MTSTGPCSIPISHYQARRLPTKRMLCLALAAGTGVPSGPASCAPYGHVNTGAPADPPGLSVRSGNETKLLLLNPVLRQAFSVFFHRLFFSFILFFIFLFFSLIPVLVHYHYYSFPPPTPSIQLTRTSANPPPLRAKSIPPIFILQNSLLILLLWGALYTELPPEFSRENLLGSSCFLFLSLIMCFIS